MEEKVFLNGSLVPKQKAKISIEDRGLLYGDGVFETMRSYEGKVFRLDRHLKRLFDSLTLLRLPMPYQQKEIGEAIYGTLKANQLHEAYIRLTVTRGEGGRGIDLPEKPSPTIIIVAKEFVPYPSHLYREGLRTGIAEIKQISSPLNQTKSLNFLHNILARIEAKQRGLNEVILINSNGFVSEGTVSNIFMIKNGTLITPDKESGILSGITRNTVIELAIHEGIGVEERKVNPSELMEADEVFLTNTLMEIMPVTEIERVKIGQGKPCPLTLKFMGWYRDLVRRELAIKS